VQILQEIQGVTAQMLQTLQELRQGPDHQMYRGATYLNTLPAGLKEQQVPQSVVLHLQEEQQFHRAEAQRIQGQQRCPKAGVHLLQDQQRCLKAGAHLFQEDQQFHRAEAQRIQGQQRCPKAGAHLRQEEQRCLKQGAHLSPEEQQCRRAGVHLPDQSLNLQGRHQDLLQSHLTLHKGAGEGSGMVINTSEDMLHYVLFFINFDK